MQDRIKRWTRELMMIPGLSGFEGNVRRYIKGELAELGIKSRTDMLGNLIATIEGDADLPSVMLIAHMDQLGLIVRKIEATGLIRAERVGGVPERALAAQEVLLSVGEDPEVLLRLVAAAYYAGDPVTAAACLERLRGQSPADPQILRLDDVPRGRFPHGGCWERLLTILDHRAGEYWLQLDSDTVTLGPVWELERAIASNRSFTLMGGADAPPEPLELGAFKQAYYPAGEAEGHVQSRIESRMDRLAPGLGWKYIRGCAGFAGFAAGNGGRELATAFLARMKAVIGDDDAGIWGTEQVASSFLIANEGAPVCLPYTRYLNYWGEDWDRDAAFIHFVGAHRYDNGAYMAASRAAIARLNA